MTTYFIFTCILHFYLLKYNDYSNRQFYIRYLYYLIKYLILLCCLLYIQDLTFIIKQDLNDLNKKIQLLSNNLKSNTKKSQQYEHKSNLLFILQNNLTKTSINFKDLLEFRTKNLKKSKERTNKFTQIVSKDNDSNKLSDFKSDSLFYNNDNMVNNSSSVPSTSSNSRRRVNRNSEHLALDLDNLESGQSQSNQSDQQFQQSLIHKQSDYLNQRSNAIDTIESTISELGQIFNQLSSMVAIQGETVQRIDADVTDISDNVNSAQFELLKYFDSIKSNRSLMFKIFGVIIIFVSSKHN